jgi:hypothetical protein
MGLYSTRNGVLTDSSGQALPEEVALSWNGDMSSSEKHKYKSVRYDRQLNTYIDGYNIFYEQRGSSHFIDVFGHGVGFVSYSRENVFKKLHKWIKREKK